MDMTVLVSVLYQFLQVVDLAHGGDGKTAKVGLDQQGLGFVIGNTADSQVAFQFS